VGQDGKLYIAGGGDRYQYFAILEVYDPVTDTWTTRTPIPTKRDGLAFVAADDGHLIAIGGRMPGGYPIATVDVYDPTSDSWSEGARMPTPRQYLAAVAARGKVYAVGGFPFGADALEVYDPAEDRWVSCSH
jgi:N-acetylneuraminic acid mutarotase